MKKVCLSLFLPFLIWLFLNQGIFTQHFFLGADNSQYFHWIIYYVEHLAQGVYPLWNPFHAWGFVDNFDMLFMGPFNPIYALMAILVRMHLDAYSVYVGVMLAYLALGYIGTYVLARRMIGGHWWAWLAYVLFLFSGFGSVVFTQLVVLLMFVPTVWFFFFLISFVQAKDIKSRNTYALGTALAVAVSLGSYVPIFFIFIFLSFIVSCLVVQPRWLLKGFQAIGLLIGKSPGLACVCLLGILLAIMPAALWYVQAKPSEYVLMVDRANGDSSHPAEVSTELAKRSSIAVIGSWEEFFTDFEGAQNFYIFVPVIVFILALICLFNRLLAWQAIVFSMGLIMLLFGLTDATPVFGFLFKHIYIFHLFRNYFFFVPFIIFLAILFLVGQLKEFLSRKGLTVPKRWGISFLILVMHGSFYYFLSTIDKVPIISFVTIGLSCFWFLFWIWKGFGSHQTLFLLSLGLICVLQPIYVLPFFSSLVKTSASPHPIQKLTFSYLRPLQGQGINEEHGFHRRIKQSLDESGFFQAGYMGTRWAYDLYTHVPSEALKEYVRHKFVLYDCTVFMSSQQPNWSLLTLDSNIASGVAYVSQQEEVGCVQWPSHAQMIEGPTEVLKVSQFNVNSVHIQTNFSTRKFMVYNDSFHPKWRAWIDGKPVRIDQANIAFKGLWVQAGKHQVVFQYESYWVSWLMMGITVLFFIWLLVTIYLLKGIRFYVD